MECHWFQYLAKLLLQVVIDIRHFRIMLSLVSALRLVNVELYLMSLLFNLKVVHVYISLSFTFYISILDGYISL